MSSPYKAFNTQLKEFIRELDRIYENESCFKFIIAGYKVLKTMKKSLPHKYFQEMVNIPHGEYLRNKDDSSVFSETYVPPPLYANIVNRLRDLWKTMDPGTKETVWNYIHVLLALNDKCIEYRKIKNMPPIETLDDDKCDE